MNGILLFMALILPGNGTVVGERETNYVFQNRCHHVKALYLDNGAMIYMTRPVWVEVGGIRLTNPAPQWQFTRKREVRELFKFKEKTDGI